MRNASVLLTVLSLGVISISAFAQNNLPTQGQSLWDWHEQFMSDPANLIGQEEEGSPWELHERTMAFWRPRLGPTGDLTIANEAMMDYLPWAAGHPKTNTTMPSNWTPMGPFDKCSVTAGGASMGQIHAIAFDPDYVNNQTIYCASGFGGMFKSTDAGDHWVPITDNKLPIAGVTDIIIDPGQPDHLFIATGNVDSEGGAITAGIYRSFDAGETWEPMNDGLMTDELSFIGMHSIEMSPGSSNDMLCATSQGIYRTMNASAANPTWVGPAPGTEDPWYKSLVYDAWQPGLVYASGTDIYRSVDGGTSWATISAPFGLDLSPGAIDARHIAVDVEDEEASQHRLFANISRWHWIGPDADDGYYENYPPASHQQPNSGR